MSAAPIGARLALIAIIATIASAHIGTDDVYFSGDAGPWPVRVSIRQPGVIPGLADINVRVQGGVSRVLVTALRRIANSGEAPPPDIAVPVRGTPGLYTTRLWLMTRGPHEVVVTIEGDRGTGVVRVPVMARASHHLSITRALRNLLFAGGAFLVIGLLTLVGAATRESVLPPGQSPGRADRRRARISVAFAGLTIGVLLFGGWSWISAEASLFNRRIDRPWSVAAAAITVDGGVRLDLLITDSLWIMRDDPAWLERNLRYRRADLIADHGKLMHMFLVREDDLGAFAHVHPVTNDANLFSVAVPPLPAGRYRVYADIAAEDGSAQTLVTAVDLPAAAPSETAPAAATSDRTGDTPAAARGRGEAPDTIARDPASPADPSPRSLPGPDPDDAWWTASDGDEAGLRIEWVNAAEPITAGTDAEFRFQLSSADGSPVEIVPYMGMAGHAMLNRYDGQVFVHLHPAGMVSMAAQQVLEAAATGRPATDGPTTGTAKAGAPVGTMAAGMPGMSHDLPAAGSVTFPLVAPPAGQYRVWVQVRTRDRVLTRAWDTTIR